MILLGLTLALLTVRCSSGDIDIISVGNNFTAASKPDIQEKRLIIGLLLPRTVTNLDSLEYHNRLDAVKPGIILAAENMKEWLPGWNYTILLGDTNCNSVQGPLTAVEMYNKYQPDVFVGPVCPYVLAPVARYAGYWNIPIISTGGMSLAFRKKSEGFNLLTCVGGTYEQFAIFFRNLMVEYQWHHVMFLYEYYSAESGKGRSMCDFALGQAFNALGGYQNERISNIPFETETANGTLYEEILKKTAHKARVVLICGPPSTVREMMLVASSLGMTQKGDYVFFNVDFFSSKAISTPWYAAGASDEENEEARLAYQSLLTITSKTVADNDFDQFRSRIEEVSTNISPPDTNVSVNNFIANFHDALILYARALNETIQATGDISSRRDGRLIKTRLWDRSIKGITGNITIDENGDRRADFALLDLDNKLQQFRVVRVYRGVSNTFQTLGQISWPAGGGPPLDVPSCGFDGSLCNSDSSEILPILLAVSFVVIVSLLVVSIFIYRHYKEEADIASMNWKIDIQEILSTEGGMGTKRGSMISINSTDGSGMQDHRKQLYVRTGYYRGSVVALKKINASKIMLNRRLLLDLKRMTDLHHNHLVRFIGACIDPYQPLLITEYCPRGSLQDILEEEEMTLDWDFRFSLINDIVKGLSFLHNSEIATHGNLKSSNCVVDSRFVLKLTDFGLHELREREDSVNPDSYQSWKSKLWTAPELLRSSSPPISGTQKGDIYSFSIILHEIAIRDGTWGLGSSFLEPKDIINKLIYSDGEMRPDTVDLILDEELKSLMVGCWAENPTDRPDTTAIKGTMKRLNTQKSSNILDNLLSRMEIYANNLETLVDERTADYLEEKRKCEELLYELLPKTVAVRLIEAGDQKVIAETYAAVTIYFSDIVGFTSISASSTPLEIVYFLNDLYTLFDSIIQQNFDVYKVETIGDAYMVVSGLPEPNGNRHASEIARMSLRILEEVQKFKIRHKPEMKLGLRIGLHTGPCVAGVVGIKMPRYCLFGDTVNTASRMESNGLPHRIHLSSDTADVLREFGIFNLELRGDIDVKGKGMMTTYWLNGVCVREEDSNTQEIKYMELASGIPSMFERRTPRNSIKQTKGKKACRQSVHIDC